MSSSATIPNLGEKITLLLHSGRSEVQSEAALLKELKIGKDYLSRLKSGTRVIADEKLQQLSEIFRIPPPDWYLPLAQFGEKISISRFQVASITGAHLPGIDFDSRNSDARRIASLFRIIEGYWESYYYSVSKVGQILVSRDLLVVQRVTPDNFIECEIIDGSFTYTGWCFPIPNHLYFILEKKDLLNEIIVYVTNLPERQPPRLYGVILCLSGGVDEVHSCPAAAKVAFRYLGNDDAMRRKHGLGPAEDVPAFMAQHVPTYIDPAEKHDVETREILDVISNIVVPGTIPSALRVTK